MHVTLAFLGEVRDALVPGVIEAATTLAALHSPFCARVEGGGAFPDWRRPRVIWLGIRDAGALRRLGDEVGSMCRSLGFPPDHPFSAHLTIGRVPHSLPIQQRENLRSTLATRTESYSFDVNRVVLLRSAPSPAGSVYSEVASFPLGGA